MLRRRRLLGRRGARQCRRPARAGRGRRARLQGVLGALRHRRISEQHRSRPARSDAGAARRRAAALGARGAGFGRRAAQPGSAFVPALFAVAPQVWEDEAIRLLVKLCRETRCPVHIVHLSSAASVPTLRAPRPRACRSRSRRVRTTCASRPRAFPTGPRCTSARRRSASTRTARACGARCWTA